MEGKGSVEANQPTTLYEAGKCVSCTRNGSNVISRFVNKSIDQKSYSACFERWSALVRAQVKKKTANAKASSFAF